MRSGVLGYKYRLQGSDEDARLFSWLLGLDVVGAQDVFLWCHRLVLLCLATKLSNVDADGLSCHLH
jgi:hypothetical protein